MATIYIHKNEEELGPYTEKEIRMHWANGLLDGEDLAWEADMEAWVPLKNFFSAPHTGHTTHPPPSPPIDFHDEPSGPSEF
ncbi:MAG: DUF4339 domain-containing protein [Verrucomicrobiota bacterium]